MSDRERWIVYPLLFLALGLALRDKYLPTKQVLTHNLIVVNDDDQPIVAIGASKEGDGVVRVGRNDQKMDLVLGNEGSTSSLFVETRTTTGTFKRAVLENLRNYAPSAPQHGFWDIPLLSPTLLQSRTQPQPSATGTAEHEK